MRVARIFTNLPCNRRHCVEPRSNLSCVAIRTSNDAGWFGLTTSRRTMTFERGSRSLLSPHDLARFSGTTLFEHIARVVCAADCLPRKELYESWAVARRVRRRLRGGRVVDLACGHGLTAAMMLLIDDESEAALAVDERLPE